MSPSTCCRWDSPLVDLFFSNQYLQVTTTVPSTSVYGFGEQEHTSFKHSMDFVTYGMFSRDQAPTVIHFMDNFVLTCITKRRCQCTALPREHLSLYGNTVNVNQWQTRNVPGFAGAEVLIKWQNHSHFEGTLKPFIRSFLKMQLVLRIKNIFYAEILVQESV